MRAEDGSFPLVYSFYRQRDVVLVGMEGRSRRARPRPRPRGRGAEDWKSLMRTSPSGRRVGAACCCRLRRRGRGLAWPGLCRKCLYLVRPCAFGPGVGAAGARRAPCVSGKELDGPGRMMRPALPSWQILTRAPGHHLTWHRKDDRIGSSCCFSPRVQRTVVFIFIYRSKHTGGVWRHS